jgi:hypothetical protein
MKPDHFDGQLCPIQFWNNINRDRLSSLKDVVRMAVCTNDCDYMVQHFAGKFIDHPEGSIVPSRAKDCFVIVSVKIAQIVSIMLKSGMCGDQVARTRRDRLLA